MCFPACSRPGCTSRSSVTRRQRKKPVRTAGRTARSQPAAPLVRRTRKGRGCGKQKARQQGSNHSRAPTPSLRTARSKSTPHRVKRAHTKTGQIDNLASGLELVPSQMRFWVRLLTCTSGLIQNPKEPCGKSIEFGERAFHPAARSTRGKRRRLCATKKPTGGSSLRAGGVLVGVLYRAGVAVSARWAETAHSRLKSQVASLKPLGSSLSYGTSNFTPRSALSFRVRSISTFSSGTVVIPPNGVV